jgi:hypothetical protein
MNYYNEQFSCRILSDFVQGFDPMILFEGRRTTNKHTVVRSAVELTGVRIRCGT